MSPRVTNGGFVAFGNSLKRAREVRRESESARGRVFCEAKCPVHEFGIERINFAFEFFADGFFVRSGFAERDVAGGPIFRNLARVDFVGEVAVENMFGPDGGAERDVGGIAAADSGDEPIGFRKIEARIETDGHDGGGGFGGADAGEDAEDAVFVQADVVIAGGERKDLIEVLALDPELIFAWGVAGVFAAFEHGDDDDFDGNRLTGLCALGWEAEWENGEHKEKWNASPDELAHEIPRTLDLLDLPDMLCCKRM